MAAEDVAAGRQGDRLGRVFASINSFVSLNNQIPRLQVTYCFVGASPRPAPPPVTA